METAAPTFSLPLPAALVNQVLADEVRRQVAAHVAALPAPDPLYTLADVAALVGVHPETVGDWTRLEPTETRYLRSVKVGEGRQSKRIQYSQLVLWCERNSSAPLPLPVDPFQRPSRGRAAALHTSHKS